MSLLDIIPIVISVFALVISSITFYWQWRDKNPRLVVIPLIKKLSVASPVPDEFGFTHRKDMLFLCVRIENHGAQSIHLESVYLQPRKDLRIKLYQESYATKQSPRFTVEPQHNTVYWVQTSELVKDLERHRLHNPIEANVIVSDEIGRAMRSKRKIRFTVEQLLEDPPAED